MNGTRVCVGDFCLAGEAFFCFIFFSCGRPRFSSILVESRSIIWEEVNCADSAVAVAKIKPEPSALSSNLPPLPSVSREFVFYVSFCFNISRTHAASIEQPRKGRRSRQATPAEIKRRRCSKYQQIEPEVFVTFIWGPVMCLSASK